MARMSDEERAALLERFTAEEVTRPLDYFPHDSNASADPKLQRLRDDHGWAAIGRWWALVELLSAAEGHLVDVSRPQQWRRLANALEFDDVDECQAFVAALLDVGLIDRDAARGGHVMSARVMRNAEKVAEGIARGRVAVACRMDRQGTK